MITVLKESVWSQFGASLDMLKDTITLCPDDFLSSNKRFFYILYHTLLFLDYYLTNPPKDFSPPLPFTIKEPPDLPEDAIDDIIPDRMYDRQELLAWLRAGRDKAYQVIANLTEETIDNRWKEDEEDVSPPVMDYSILEILLYNMRHVQHHTAQLNMLLRQGINVAPGWKGRAGEL